MNQEDANKSNPDRRLRVLISKSTDPWFNLATEEWIFRDMDPSVQTLFIWRNHDTVVIGRNQNPWAECNLTSMETEGVRLARRTTGGGAVFQDLGNTCFTFLSPRNEYSRSRNLDIVLRALSRFGIKAEASGRNDLVVMSEDGPKKISGSAFRESRDRAFHHGTLLINANLARLANYLTPNPKKLESKGRASVRSRVANLVEFTTAKNGLSHEDLEPVLIEEFTSEYFNDYGMRPEIKILDPVDLNSVDYLSEKVAEFSSWDWRYGKAPKFNQQMSHYFDWGFVDVHIDAEDGRISRAQIFSDSLYPDLIDDFAQNMISKTFGRLGLDTAYEKTFEKHPDRKAELLALASWLTEEFEIDEKKQGLI